MTFHAVATGVRVPLCLATIVVSLLVAVPHAQVPVPGRNSNLASGPAEIILQPGSNPPIALSVKGDLLLKQDNEGSCARGSRNPKNILCGGNDYGLVDVPGIDPDDVVRDAGAGVYQSADGGDTWESTMLRGHVLDHPSAGILKNYTAFADVTTRSGAAGIAYMTGIAFKSKNNTSIGYLATFLELNNKEHDRMPFKHLYTVKFDSVPETLLHDPLTATAFIDKPWSVVLPTSGATCSINTTLPDGTRVNQTIPDSPVIIGYTIFLSLEKHPDLRLATIMTVKVTNCGRTVSRPKLIGLHHRANGIAVAASPKAGSKRVAAVWRRFKNKFVTDALLVSVSNDSGKSWSFPREMASICPFEQASTAFSARVNTFPTVAIDHTNRIIVAWSDRLKDPTTGNCLEAGQSRIVVSSSSNGNDWTGPTIVDPGTDPSQPAQPMLGHQITPSLTYGGGTLLLLWKDLRETAANFFDRFIDEYPLIKAARGETADIPPPHPLPIGGKFFHHTIELYSKMANISSGQLRWGPSVRVSQYKLGKFGSDPEPQQIQFEIINQKIFAKGTKVFDGDYADGAGPPMLPPDPKAVPARQTWTFDTGQNGDPVFYGVWASNRDVHRVFLPPGPDGTRPPTPYTPPGFSWTPRAVTDPVCSATTPWAKTMDQNLYGARISRGNYAFSPGNNKQVRGFQRAYVVTVRNESGGPLPKIYRLTIPVAFRDLGAATTSFAQFSPDFVRFITVAPNSTASRSVFIIPKVPGTQVRPNTRLRVQVDEIAAVGGATLGSTSVYLNGDPTAPEIEAPEIEAQEIYTPEIEAATIKVHSIAGSEVASPEIEAPEIEAPEIEAPEIEALSILTPEIEAPEIEAPEIEAPEIEAPEIEAAAITDVVWPVTNEGNTTAGYIVRPLVGGDRTGFDFQLVVSRIVKIPTFKVAASGCTAAFATMNKVALNLLNANTLVDEAAVITPEELDNATIWVAPGERILITLRVRGDVAFDPVSNPTRLRVAQQAIDTRFLPPIGSPPPVPLPTPPVFESSAAGNLQFLVQPQNIGNGSAFDPPVQVIARDNTGAVLPGITVSLELVSPPSVEADLFGPTSAVTDANGVATFDPMGVNGTANGFRLRAFADGVPSTDSALFNVTGPATFVVTNTVDGGDGSLREAIISANNNGPGLDTITFSFDGSGPFFINPESPLPTITSAVIIDGFSLPGSGPGFPQIILNGSDLVGAPGASGLTIAGDTSTVRGLVINAFPGPGITVTSSGSSIRGNFIGTDETGQSAVPNAQGIAIGSTATGTTIGGDVVDDRNIIGGNSEFGIIIEGHGTTVRGNIIGRNPEGPTGVPNGMEDVAGGAAIMLLGGASNNYIGSPLGVDIPAPNFIGQNFGRGIVLSNGGVAGVGAAGSGNGIGLNIITGNEGLGIDLGNDGVTNNDPGDADLGPNGFQNSPELTAAVNNGESTVVTTRLSSLPDTRFLVSFYANAACHVSGSGEGETHLGNFIVNTDATGLVVFNSNFFSLSPGTFVTAFASTVTAAPGNQELNSSEFSPCRQVVSGVPPPEFDKVWVGGAPLEPTRWHNPDNWSPQGVPTPAQAVFIQLTPDQPLVDAEGAVVRTLTLGDGASVELAVGGLDAEGSVDAELGTIFGPTPLRMNGLEVNLKGNVERVLVQGNVFANGDLTGTELRISGDSGTYSVGGNEVVVENLVTQVGGRLRMSEGSIVQTHDATFSGGSTVGQLTAGELRISGSFVQVGNQQAFAASGGHRTVFNGGGDDSVSFEDPAPGNSHFNEVQFDVPDIQFDSDVLAIGQLVTTGTASPLISSEGRTLMSSGLNVAGIRLNSTRLISNLGTLTRFDNALFQNFGGETPLLTIINTGAAAPIDFQNIQFDTNPDFFGNFLNLTDVDPELDTEIRLLEVSPGNPATGCSRSSWQPSVAQARIRWNGTLCGG